MAECSSSFEFIAFLLSLHRHAIASIVRAVFETTDGDQIAGTERLFLNLLAEHFVEKPDRPNVASVELAEEDDIGRPALRRPLLEPEVFTDQFVANLGSSSFGPFVVSVECLAKPFDLLTLRVTVGHVVSPFDLFGWSCLRRPVALTNRGLRWRTSNFEVSPFALLVRGGRRRVLR